MIFNLEKEQGDKNRIHRGHRESWIKKYDLKFGGRPTFKKKSFRTPHVLREVKDKKKFLKLIYLSKLKKLLAPPSTKRDILMIIFMWAVDQILSLIF